MGLWVYYGFTMGLLHPVITNQNMHSPLKFAIEDGDLFFLVDLPSDKMVDFATVFVNVYQRVYINPQRIPVFQLIDGRCLIAIANPLT